MPEIVQNIQGKLQENQRKSFKIFIESKKALNLLSSRYIPKICKSINPKFGLFAGSFVFCQKVNVVIECFLFDFESS